MNTTTGGQRCPRNGAHLPWRLQALFQAAYPDHGCEQSHVDAATEDVVHVVLDHEVMSSFRRLFIQSYMAVLYRLRRGGAISRDEVVALVTTQQQAFAKEGA
jgi:hypothetical protein